MIACQLVFFLHQRIKNLFVVKALGKGQIMLISGDRKKMCERLGHPAVLSPEHVLELRFVQVISPLLGPVGELNHHLQRLFVVGVEIDIKQAGEGLVKDIPRDITTSDAPFVSLQVATVDVLPDLGTDGAGVAIAMLLLGFGDFADHVIDAFLEALVARTGVHQGQGAHVVTGGLPNDILTLPATIALTFGRQASAFVIRPEHPVGVEIQQVLLVDLHRSLEGAREQFHLAEVERIGLHLRLGGDLRLTIIAVAHRRGRHRGEVGHQDCCENYRGSFDHSQCLSGYAKHDGQTDNPIGKYDFACRSLRRSSRVRNPHSDQPFR